MKTRTETDAETSTELRDNRVRDISVNTARALGAITVFGGFIIGNVAACSVTAQTDAEGGHALRARDSLVSATAELLGERKVNVSDKKSILMQDFLDKDTFTLPTKNPDPVEARRLIHIAGDELEQTHRSQHAASAVRQLEAQQVLDPNEILDAAESIEYYGINNGTMMYLEKAQFITSGGVILGGIALFGLANLARKKED